MIIIDDKGEGLKARYALEFGIIRNCIVRSADKQFKRMRAGENRDGAVDNCDNIVMCHIGMCIVPNLDRILDDMDRHRTGQ